ncbi:CLUMA_CG019760, isoform A [Clunio marinus]|uniref:CLUMA_CG019760, isoform A n=1 Tax=Clunio marinus TaxID=568069 RepID=A0A1J1J4U4_9DIPT|nr:CLUMA_CG019760, isoform A [Clunio marinus]
MCTYLGRKEGKKEIPHHRNALRNATKWNFDFFPLTMLLGLDLRFKKKNESCVGDKAKSSPPTI